jgi:hypothetical protein
MESNEFFFCLFHKYAPLTFSTIVILVMKNATTSYKQCNRYIAEFTQTCCTYQEKEKMDLIHFIYNYIGNRIGTEKYFVSLKFSTVLWNYKMHITREMPKVNLN